MVILDVYQVKGQMGRWQSIISEFACEGIPGGAMSVYHSGKIYFVKAHPVQQGSCRTT